MPVERIPYKQFHFPKRRTLLRFCGAFCLLALLVFFVYPPVLGWVVAVVFGAGSLPAFWLEHPALYGALQSVIRFVYGLCVVGTLDFFVLLYTYRLLDQLVVRSGVGTGAWVVALRAWKRLFGLHVLCGLVLCLFLGWWNHFSAYSLIPALASSSLLGNLWTGFWEMTAVCFALGFATQESFRGAVQQGWELVRSYPIFWTLFIVVLLILVWVPVQLLATFGLENGGAASVVLNLWGALTHFLLLSGALVYLLNRSDLFVTVQQQ